jgi:hypothetical protein
MEETALQKRALQELGVKRVFEEKLAAARHTARHLIYLAKNSDSYNKFVVPGAEDYPITPFMYHYLMPAV